jgi:hypothetical protein
VFDLPPGVYQVRYARIALIALVHPSGSVFVCVLFMG